LSFRWSVCIFVLKEPSQERIHIPNGNVDGRISQPFFFHGDDAFLHRGLGWLHTLEVAVECLLVNVQRARLEVDQVLFFPGEIVRIVFSILPQNQKYGSLLVGWSIKPEGGFR